MCLGIVQVPALYSHTYLLKKKNYYTCFKSFLTLGHANIDFTIFFKFYHFSSQLQYKNFCDFGNSALYSHDIGYFKGLVLKKTVRKPATSHTLKMLIEGPVTYRPVDAAGL
jgi:hypothetical protein